jgi:hypothetical protein
MSVIQSAADDDEAVLILVSVLSLVMDSLTGTADVLGRTSIRQYLFWVVQQRIE